MAGRGDPYSGDREPDLCGLSYGTAEYADGMLKLPETVEREESCTCGGEGPQIWYRRVLLRDEEGREVHAGHYAGGLLRDGASMGRCKVPA